MTQYFYEGMFLLDSGRYGRDPEGVAGQIPAIIRDAGGEMLVSRLWEERRLAFSIKGRRKGAYWLTYFKIDGQRMAQVRRQCQLNESILRVLFLKVDPRIIDALVEHARSGPAAAAPVGPPAGDAAAAAQRGRSRGAVRAEEEHAVIAAEDGNAAEAPAPEEK